VIGTTIQDVLPGGMSAGMDEQLRPWAAKWQQGLRTMMEAAFDIGDGWIDPEERFRDPESGEVWRPLGGEDVAGRSSPLVDEEQLARARREGRNLATYNEYAINGHENRVNYVVGSGHIYTAGPKEAPGVDASDAEKAASEEAVAEVQAVIDDFVKVNKWHKRQQEIVRRKDRDGEVFLRFFKNTEKGLLVRAVEPSQVSKPDASTDDNASYGIVTEPDDVETVTGYWIDGELVDAAEIQHRKLGVDANVKRGIPLFFPCSKDLQRVDTIQRNMAVMSTIQSAIAMIRKHASATATAISNFVANNADVQTTSPYTKATKYHKKFGAGTILDADQGIEYEFPSSKVRPDAFIGVRDAILRSVASRLVMPEFMLTSDASNANYSSTMVAEGPAVKQFNRLQWDMIEDDREVIELALDLAVEQGKLSLEAREATEVDVEPPRLETRDRAVETEADMKLVTNKVMSKHTAAIRQDLDPDTERDLIEKETEASDPFAGMDTNPLFQQGQQPGQVPNEEGEEEDEQ